ncbi:MAG: transcription-repair coupling factor, partial [Alphaproteobacteria bacterium]|nr:transcription-repair coupling factor [Alphaproteobacteria bacterium]
SSLTPGELVVHAEHGIGRFEGLVTVEVMGAAHDCLKLVYDGEDKLFIPVENIDVLTRYGSHDEEGEAKLDKLGGVAWQARKAKMKERIKIAAEALLKVAAARAIHPAPVLIPPQGVYDEFAARFPYVETEDQERSISEVLEDLASGHPSDRLVCGDVGFGKTEVAMRAAFAAASAENGKVQVVVVTPTTLLCRQHYANFKERFAGLPITIRQLSRLVTAKQATETRAGLKDGSVDIVIGTHAVLAKSIEFANLGLVIVDEEQHFGVVQKERLKALKHNVHVLTLSATPIPRTLQLALTGVRDLSLITTPPVDRLAVRSFVMPVDTLVLREAILREKHRAGRVFYVVPRIKDLPDVSRLLKEHVPEVRIAVAHGQMPPAELDEIMTDFYEGKYDLLLSTTIIESGLDIPTANTMIIHKADRFGLSQLYQLRGRVGRGKTRAYAYFTLPHGKTLTKQAMQRLEVMQTLDTLGAGFTLASHDMDIRGFGNLVGEEQSGHVREVGVELYQQMFEEAVASAKREQLKDAGKDLPPPAERWTPQINLGISVLIPESFVPDLQLRLGLYRRMGSLHTNEEVDAFAVELADRFGQLPEETEHLLEVLKLKILCRMGGVEKVDVGPKGAVLAFRNDTFAQPEKLVTYLTRNPRSVKIRHDQKLVLMRDWKPDAKSRLAELTKALGDIAALAA